LEVEMTRYLMVTWDGAGNLVSTLGIARTLVAEGHDVRMIGHASIEERCGDQGARFIPFTPEADWDPLQVPANFEEEMAMIRERLCFNPAIANDVLTELEREAADVLVVDCMLFTALSAAEASGIPTATLVHTPYTIFRGGPLVELFAVGLEPLNRHRAGLGLPPVAELVELHDGCELAIVALPKEFEPESPDAPNVFRMGPVLDAPALQRTDDSVDLGDGSTPLVLVSLSTAEQGQIELLQSIADAVAGLPVRAIMTTGPAVDPAMIAAGPNTEVVQYQPHAEILPTTSLVITHAGLGTVMASLGHGVPLLCVPMGRDQFFNAERVAAMGAGLMLPPGADPTAIADAASTVLDDVRFRDAAGQFAGTIGRCGGAVGAVSQLEALARSTSAELAGA
jgi:UDP:flavonoid glycosyltransferase YjiC (YdhE family)